MKTTLGGNRIGSGDKQKYSMRNYERSTHDLSYLWRSSMSAGTLVPFLNEVALPGDSFDIDLNTEVVTLPTIGPLFGSFKVQLDVFACPMRLYNAALHMNKLDIGLSMNEIYMPQLPIGANRDADGVDPLDNTAQINPSSLVAYLGIKGVGNLAGSTSATVYRHFNATSWLAYWNIYKNYYANKQEERGFLIGADTASILGEQAILHAYIWPNGQNGAYGGDALGFEVTAINFGEGGQMVLKFGAGAVEPSTSNILVDVNQTEEALSVSFTNFVWDDDEKTLTCDWQGTLASGDDVLVDAQSPEPATPRSTDLLPAIIEFPLSNIDTMRERILQHTPTNTPFVTSSYYEYPYESAFQGVGSPIETRFANRYSQNGLALKTYQSDLFNNWISTEWIDGTGGINEVTAVSTTGDEFTIDALNLASKVYNMLNRIAISGGTYDDYLDAVYSHQRKRGIEDPMYLGSLIKELSFEEVISTANADSGQVSQALGTLAGRGRLTPKNKGGKIRYKCDEPSVILGIVSITPRLTYSQGNDWHTGLVTFDDFHKPALDQIGFQELIVEQMAWQSTDVTAPDQATAATATQASAGKQPAWINYMTSYNRSYGNFADVNKEMFMTLNRRYDIAADGSIDDLTTYVDPTKFNNIFADANIDAQNFWVHIAVKNIARRKMSAKVIPNL